MAFLAGGTLGSKNPFHPNDNVNYGQSSNDTFPTAMHISTALQIEKRMLPSLDFLVAELRKAVERLQDIIKIGRTHLQDATPLTLGQEFSGFLSMVENRTQRINGALATVYELGQGGTAVGTGISSYNFFAGMFAVSKQQQQPPESKQLKGLISKLDLMPDATWDCLPVEVSSALSTTAADLLKVANDIRLVGFLLTRVQNNAY